MTRVKICGLRDPLSVATAIEEGVHAIGFVFYAPSPRSLAPEEARRLCADIPPFVSKVGVFVDQEPSEIVDIAHSVGLDTIQLHSEKYTEENILFLKSLWSFRLIKAVRIPFLDDHLIEKVRLTQAHALLFDSWHPSEFGGTGQRISLNLSERSHQWLQHKAIIAGGITIDNLADVLAVRPYGIDVSSGVEKTKGVKDPSLIRAFLRRFYEIVSHA